MAATLLTILSATRNSSWIDPSTRMWPSTNAAPSLLRSGGMKYRSADGVGTWIVTVGLEERLNSRPFHNTIRNGMVKPAGIRLNNFSRRYSINIGHLLPFSLPYPVGSSIATATKRTSAPARTGDSHLPERSFGIAFNRRSLGRTP